MTWEQIKSEWSSGWAALEAQALATYEVAIEADPEAFRAKLVDVLGLLEESRSNLDRMKAALKAELRAGKKVPASAIQRLKKLEQRYNDLAAGVYADTQPATNQVGSLVVGLIVAGVVFGVAAIAFGIAAYQYCANLRDQTALAEKELDERVQAARDGVVIPTQPLTTPPPAPVPSQGAASLGKVVGGLALVAAAGVAWWTLRQ